MLKYKRALLKLSGEALSLDGEILDFDKVDDIASQIGEVKRIGAQIGIVIGGGNIWRGRSSGQMDRNRADHMGMLATTINSIAMLDALERIGVEATVLSAQPMERFCDTYTHRGAMKCLSEGKIVIFAGGTGSPFFSTDTAAALRAAEISADIMLLAKNVDGIYSSDPMEDKTAVKFDHMTYDEVILSKQGAIDMTAITMCREQSIPILAFAMKVNGNIMRAFKGDAIGTLVD